MGKKLVGVYKILNYPYHNSSRLTIPSEVLKVWGKVPERVFIYVNTTTGEMIVKPVEE